MCLLIFGTPVSAVCCQRMAPVFLSRQYTLHSCGVSSVTGLMSPYSPARTFESLFPLIAVRDRWHLPTRPGSTRPSPGIAVCQTTPVSSPRSMSTASDACRRCRWLECRGTAASRHQAADSPPGSARLQADERNSNQRFPNFQQRGTFDSSGGFRPQAEERPPSRRRVRQLQRRLTTSD